MKILKYSLGFIDQGVLSLASILFLVLAAQFLSAEQLGTFVLGLSTAVLIQSLVRALSGETLLVRSTREDFAPGERERCLGLSLLVAFAIGTVMVTLSFAVPQSMNFYLSLGAAQFGLLVQDGVRFAAVSTGRTGGLLALDCIYTVISCSSIYFAGLLGLAGDGMLMFLGASATVVGVSAMFAFRLVPRCLAGVHWLAKHWRLNSSFVSEAVLGAVLGYSITLILNFYASGPELAAYRSALSIFGMTSLAINFLRTIVLRDLRPAHLQRKRSYWRKMTAMSILVAATVGATYLVLANLPEQLGSSMFGETWIIMVGLFGAAALNRFFAGLSVVPTVFLRVQGVTWRATLVRIVVTILGFGLGPVGAFLAGAQGALLAEAVLYLMLALSLTVLSRRSTGRPLHRLSRPNARKLRGAVTASSASSQA
ncbi:hypothetical protein DM793_21460 [Paenarthrobacter nitroguajacolicus]|uniref:hypothetical protein n=1 Tax=Paenarthrobacter nitroguajacolicus TaxID=211146 RepID=UPI0015B7CFD0|nr:hypothetical protein [Paenarthrobacter nitroguajacolicus]NWL13833.1 hypothetical protein [Paenarthrobacter nitroguajacolicus]